MPALPAELTAADCWITALTTRAAASAPAPFSFLYGGAPSSALLPNWDFEAEAEAGDPLTLHTVAYSDPATGLRVRAEVKQYHDFPAVEWVLRLRNTGDAATPIIESLQPLDLVRPELPDPVVVRHSKGALCSAEDFELLERVLRPRGELCLQAGWGRSSSEVMPFFNVMMGDRGLVLAVGWTGEWAVRFSRDEAGGLRLEAGMADTHFRLHPGEEVRTPRILILAWAGEPMRGHNLLRRLILAHHRPRPGGAPLVAPLCNGNWGGTPAEVHLDNVRQVIQHDLPFEYYWIDAEWFGKPGHWMENAGDWTPRADLYPEGFRPISEALHRSGRKLLVWFEPERVAPGTPWYGELGDWLLSLPPEKAVTWADYGDHMGPQEWVRWESARNQLNAGDRLFDLGHPEARRFLTDHLSDKITDFGVDCLRWDSNIAQLAYWRQADAEDRRGITEIRYVEGQYALWDELLERHPGLIIDNCSSGGRRIDLETVSRATPLWRTDYAVGHRDCAVAQAHTHGIMHWVPINGGGGGYLKDFDDYTLRSNMCASFVAGLWGSGDARQGFLPADYPYDHARRLLEQYLAVRRFYYGDFYPLTEYTRAQDAWMAYQLDLPESGEGLVVVLKRPQSPFTRATLRLRGLEKGREYAFRPWEGPETWVLTGRAVMQEGLEITLTEQPDSALILYSAK